MPSETPLDWIGSSKKDLLAFPEPVIGAMGYALGVAQLGGKHPQPSRGRATAAGYLRWWRAMTATPIALYIQCALPT
jgi:phage-related protein